MEPECDVLDGETYSAPDESGTYTVELDGFARTEETARRRDALRSLRSLVCWASRLSLLRVRSVCSSPGFQHYIQ